MDLQSAYATILLSAETGGSMMGLASILILGIAAQWLAWRIKIPAILPLILIGLCAGPLPVLFGGNSLIVPQDIFAGATMSHFISLSVGVILFEGGLTLKFQEIKGLVATVRNMLIYGAIIMTAGGAISATYILGLDYRVALLFGTLIVVTGPTVIQPIIQSVRPKPSVAAILKWEGITIDPIGALLAVLIYEIFFMAMGHSGADHSAIDVIQNLLIMLLTGIGGGVLFGWILHECITRKLVPHYLINVFVLAFVIMSYSTADWVQHESGLLVVTIMGIMIANKPNADYLDEIIDFKESITMLLISVLFIVLSANLSGEDIQRLNDPNIIFVFLIIILVLRPIVVWLSSQSSALTWKEKAFIAFVGPKGIVAAAVAAIFALKINSGIDNGYLPDSLRSDAELLVPLTFSIILGTVLLNGLFSGVVANLLQVKKRESNGLLIIGAHPFAQRLAAHLAKKDLPVTLADTNQENVRSAGKQGLRSLEVNALSDKMDDMLTTEDVGQMLALTPSNDVNIFSCQKFEKIFGEENVSRICSKTETENSSLSSSTRIMGKGRLHFPKIMAEFNNTGQFMDRTISKADLQDRWISREEIFPVMIIDKRGKQKVFTPGSLNFLNEGDVVVHLVLAQ